MTKIAIICKYIPSYRHSVFNQLSRIEQPQYEFIADTKGREGIHTVSTIYSNVNPEEGGFRWVTSKSFYYRKSLQYWQTNVVSKIFKKNYRLFILEGTSSHISIWVFSVLCRLAGKKVIFWSHGLKGTDRGIKKTIRIFFFKYLPHGLILYGNYSKQIMIKNGFDPNRIFVIGNSLDYYTQKKTRENLLLNESILQNLKSNIFENDLKTIIFIGRLVENKKIEQIVETINVLNKKNLPLNCIIIGDGPFKSLLQEKIKQLDLIRQFYFTGALYKEKEIAQFFLISDLMVSPGNVGLNCIHALSYGVPVITHNNFSFQNPEVEAIIPGKNGLLYEYNQFSDLHNKVYQWFSNNHVNIWSECVEPIEKCFNPKNHASKINQAVLHFIK